MYLSKWNVERLRNVVVPELRRRASGKTDAAPCGWDGTLLATGIPSKIPKAPKLCEEGPKVAILGAGMAGMSAASRLATVGLDNFVVLEANNRVGGRVYSSWSGEGLIEAGAEWLEGEWNPVLRLVSLEGLTSCREDMTSGAWLDKKGKPMGHAIVDEGKKAFSQVLDDAVKTFCEKRESDFYGVSLLSFFKEKEKKMEWKNPEAKAIFQTLCYSGVCRLGGPAEDLSLNDLAVLFRSESRCRIREGMVGVFGPMMSDVPKDKIKFQHKVQTVHWDECPIRIVLEDCSEMTADFVLVTFSLGVLRNNPELFEPELPEDKGEAFRNTGYGTINKVFLDYAEPFWLRGDGRVFLSRPPDHDCDDWSSSVIQIREICGGRNTLQISLCGKPAIELEEIPEEEIAKNVTAILRKYTGVKTTPFPIAVTRTRWSADPCFMGSVSFMGKYSNKKHLRVLAQPLPGLHPIPKLLFAGDATSGGYIGRVEGARLSGYREAQRIIDVICTSGWPPKPRHNLQQFMYNQK